jgi:hypothetical protein
VLNVYALRRYILHVMLRLGKLIFACCCIKARIDATTISGAYRCGKDYKDITMCCMLALSQGLQKFRSVLALRLASICYWPSPNNRTSFITLTLLV